MRKKAIISKYAMMREVNSQHPISDGNGGHVRIRSGLDQLLDMVQLQVIQFLKSNAGFSDGCLAKVVLWIPLEQILAILFSRNHERQSSLVEHDADSSPASRALGFGLVIKPTIRQCGFSLQFRLQGGRLVGNYLVQSLDIFVFRLVRGRKRGEKFLQH